LGSLATGGSPAAAAPGEHQVTILFVGDLVGGTGRRTLLDCLPLLRERYAPTFVVVNGENVAGGLGITPKTADELLAAGVDAITLGNHAYHRREIYPYLDAQQRILRPANYLRGQPGHGYCVVEHDDVKLGVVNLSGNVFLQAGRSAFAEIEVVLGELREADHILVDMHAEATSEKVGMGWHLDGRVTAVVGTHTHVPTADARVLPGGTAYITDVGMTGSRGGVIGVKREQALQSLVTQMPIRFETSDEDPWLMAVVVRCSRRRRADAIEQVLMPRPAASLTPARRSAPAARPARRRGTTGCTGRTSGRCPAAARSAPPRPRPRVR
jgi:metallophosphoesterase (TIGR00282 family)